MNNLKNWTQLSPQARILKSIGFAANKHRNQRRKDADATPYINHPIALTVVLADEGDVEDTVVLQAAALHDTLEDTDTSYEELVAHFGAEVADVVAEVSDDKSLPKMERRRLQIQHAWKKSEKAALVSIADKIVNLRDIASNPPAGWSKERCQEYFDWALAVVNGLNVSNVKLQEAFTATVALRP